MKKYYFIVFLILFAVTIMAQKKMKLTEEFATAENERISYWKQGQYDKAIKSMKELYNYYLATDSVEKQNNSRAFEILNYNIARAYSLQGQADSAVEYLQKYYDLVYTTYSTYYREIDYYHLCNDKDLDNIRDDSKFKELIAKYKTTGWINILREYKTYKTVDSKLISFVYADADWGNLPQLREKYKLYSIAGTGGNVSRIIELMKWVHQKVRYDGNSGEPEDRHADALIEFSMKENKGLNCWMLSTILNEIYLAMGFKSRIVSCYPKGDPSITHEWHVIVEVFSTALDKWLWMDPTLETYVKDDKGNLLSIAEVRERLIKSLPIFASSKINTNGEFVKDGGKRHLYDYMAKNLFRISIPLFSIPAYEMIPSKARIYVELLPDGYNPRKVAFHKIIGRNWSDIYTTDDKQFWAKPDIK